MSDIMEKWVNEEAEKARLQTREEIARNFLKSTSLGPEEIAKNSGLPLERVLELAGEKTA